MSLVELTCCNCGIQIGLNSQIYDAWQKSQKSFYCPNGHSIFIIKAPGSSLEEQVKLKTEVTSLEEKVKSLKEENELLKTELEIWKPEQTKEIK